MFHILHMYICLLFTEKQSFVSYVLCRRRFKKPDILVRLVLPLAHCCLDFIKNGTASSLYSPASEIMREMTTHFMVLSSKFLRHPLVMTNSIPSCFCVWNTRNYLWRECIVEVLIRFEEKKIFRMKMSWMMHSWSRALVRIWSRFHISCQQSPDQMFFKLPLHHAIITPISFRSWLQVITAIIESSCGHFTK